MEKKYTPEEAAIIIRFTEDFFNSDYKTALDFLRANTQPSPLPCPFCGRVPEKYPSGIVHCSNIYCAAWHLNRPVEEWNTRA